MRESYIESKFVRMCKEQGIKTMKMIPTYEAGIPDRQALYAGVSGFAEIKALGKKPRPLQLKYLSELKKAGFYVGVIDSEESAENWIREFLAHVQDILTQKAFRDRCGKQIRIE